MATNHSLVCHSHSKEVPTLFVCVCVYTTRYGTTTTTTATNRPGLVIIIIIRPSSSSSLPTPPPKSVDHYSNRYLPRHPLLPKKATPPMFIDRRNVQKMFFFPSSSLVYFFLTRRIYKDHLASLNPRERRFKL